jgi:mycothiol synthase
MADGVGDRFTIAAAREDDLDDVVGLIEAADRSLGVPPDPVREELRWVWHLATTDLERDTRLVRDGRTLVAYAEATWKDPDAGEPLEVLVRVPSDRTGTGIGGWLLDWAEAVAEERGCQGIRAWAVDRDADLQDLLRSHGFVHVRSAFTMWKVLAPDEKTPSPPDGVTIRSYTGADERTLYELHQAAFAEHWGFHPISFERWKDFLYTDAGWDPSLVFMAEADGSAIGYVVGFLEEICGFVGMLGVLKPYRGRGIAKALLHRSFSEFSSRGKSNVRLAVDAENVHGAVALYESVGMTVRRRYDSFDRGTPEAASVGNAS